MAADPAGAETAMVRADRLNIEIGADAGMTWIGESSFRAKPHWGGRLLLRTSLNSSISGFVRVVPQGGAFTSEGQVIPGFSWTTGLDVAYGRQAGRLFPYVLLSPGVGQFRGDPSPIYTIRTLGLGGGVGVDLGSGVRLRLEGRYNRLWAGGDIFDSGASSRSSSRELTLGLDMPFHWPEGDEDFDGVGDRRDACRGTPTGVQVDARGCPLDGDGDGVADGLDLCPRTPAGATVDRSGCTLDRDDDEVPDGIDQCAKTPAGAVVDRRGCAVDSDGDRVPDGIDLCPDTPAGSAIDENGCPQDEHQLPSSEMKAALASPVRIDATETDVADVLRLLGQQTGINVVVDSSVGGVITLHVEDLAGTDALDLIVAAAGMTYYWDHNAVVVTTREKLQTGGAVRSVAVPVRHVRAGDLVPTLSTLLDKSNIEVGPRGQHLIVTSTPNLIAEARDLVKTMDRPLPQVAIEVRVVEIAVDRLRELGLNLTANRKGSTLITGVLDPPVFATAPAGLATLSKSTSAYALDATLEALERRGQTRLLASPRLVTLAGHNARILIGDRVPYFTTNFTEDGNREIVVQFVEVGIRLDLLPQVQADRTITTHIRTEVSSIVSFRGPLQEIPWVKTREAETIVRVERGQWVSLGGMLSREERRSVVSVPVVGDIPVLGRLFQSRTTQDVETEVVIMISPTLVK